MTTITNDTQLRLDNLRVEDNKTILDIRFKGAIIGTFETFLEHGHTHIGYHMKSTVSQAFHAKNSWKKGDDYFAYFWNLTDFIAEYNYRIKIGSKILKY